ncbi:TetR family transcriptional regulator [Galbibacter marinus]|uniref:TetR family transcriptional regulator n=1 Tax=Galbibacter marinus TaxID=555500 RepID=K2PPS3_9FLAO|nr:TetR/AcrR family transcriptional regulator [Galbibacter marinus]EKF54555.1 TetR family transcriptional regulator [Galbibacter marinus]
MRPQKALDKEVINGLTEVFCSKGYEGASLQDLAAASGLKKASLYHRFPDGKKEMADAVFLHLHDFIQQNVFDVLQDDNLKPEVRLQIALDNIAVLYDGGKRTCILRALSMEAGIDLFGKQIQDGMKQWIERFERIGVELNLSTEVANDYALQTLIDIQGSLVLTRGIGNTNIFDRTLKNISKRYLE